MCVVGGGRGGEELVDELQPAHPAASLSSPQLGTQRPQGPGGGRGGRGGGVGGGNLVPVSTDQPGERMSDHGENQAPLQGRPQLPGQSGGEDLG